MMWKEFEEIAGYEVSAKDYNEIIEPMYMALDVSKYDFVKMLDKKRFALPSPAALKKEIKKEARHLYEICGRYTDYESRDRLEKAAKKYASRKYGLDWYKDTEVYCYFLDEYEYPEIKRGCTFPITLVIGRGSMELERMKLI